MNYKDFKSRLVSAKTEETVKAIYAKYFHINYNTANNHDLYTAQVLFEFKFDKNIENIKALSTILAQVLYYIRRLIFDDSEKMVPVYLCIADRNESVITRVINWKTYYSNDAYNWELPPSKPDSMLIDHLINEPEIRKIHIYKVTQKSEHDVFKKHLDNCLCPQMELEFKDKKVINEENFEAAFLHWKNVLGKYVINGYKMSEYFLSNLQPEKVLVDHDNNRVVFMFEGNNSKIQKILMKDYKYFWNIYQQIEHYDVIRGIHAKLDRLTDESQRRFEGEFYTPLRFAKKAIHYFGDILGKDWHKTGKYRIWDMAAGTGNLEWHLPAEAYKYLYMSTLHASEIEHNKKVFRDATCFQYDYLNDDIEHLYSQSHSLFKTNWKLPEKLRSDLKDTSLTWIIFINPPFATAQVGGATGKSKQGVSKTKVEIQMDSENIGHAKRELFAQFMFRIVTELPKKTFLGMFSKLKYLNASDSIDFRNKYFNFQFKKGFVFKSTNFQGVKGEYPIGFLIWDLEKKGNSKNMVKLAICNDEGISIGVKHIRLIEKDDVINKWFIRPQNSEEFILPPLSNGITIKNDNVDKRHRARPDFLASICSNGNDFQHSKYVTILSSPSVSAGAFTVNKEIFEKALVLHAVKKIPLPTWLNDRNQFLKPQKELTVDFLNDCVIWSLFSYSNETTALKDVNYNGKIYQIRNNFFPFSMNTLKKWEIKNPDFKTQITNDTDRFVANWLCKRRLSKEAQDVLVQGKNIYKIFYANLNIMSTIGFKIDYWDTGWYQIRRCLTENQVGLDDIKTLKTLSDILSEKIHLQIYDYEFLEKDEVFEKI